MFNDFNQSQFQIDNEDILGHKTVSSQYLVNLIFSLSALQSSIGTLKFNRQQTALTPNYANGMRHIHQDSETGDSGKEPMRDRFKYMINNYLNSDSYYENYLLSSRSLNELKTMIEICKYRQIDLKIFISPEHATQLEAIRLMGLWSVFEEWKRQINQVTPIWDFSTYNRITTEKISDNMTYFLDGTHYSPEVGDLILNKIFSDRQENVSQGFGIILTPATIESHLNQIRTDRELWTQNNPDEVKLVQDIKREYDVKRKSQRK